MLRCLAIVPLLFATALLADDENPLQQALARRIRAAERVVELSKPIKSRMIDPTLVEAAEVERAEAELDATTDPVRRLAILQRIVEISGRRMLLAEKLADERRIMYGIREAIHFRWLMARLQVIRATQALHPEGPGEIRSAQARRIAHQAITVAEAENHAAEILWDAGVLPSEDRLRAIDDRCTAAWEAAESDEERNCELEICAGKLDYFQEVCRAKAAVSLGGRPYYVMLAWLASLQAQIASAKANRIPGDRLEQDLEQLRTLRQIGLWTLLRMQSDEADEGHVSILYLDRDWERALNCPTECFRPGDWQVIHSQAEWILDRIERALQNPKKKDPEMNAYDVGRLELLQAKLAVWNLRHRAAEDKGELREARQ